MNTGFIAMAAARAAADGADLDAVAAAAAAATERNHGFIVVHQLDNLRRSGRIGGAGAWLGTKLSLKPLLRIDDGKLVLAQRVRTANKAVATMIDRVCEIVGERPASIAVHHVANPDGAQNLAAALAERLPGCEPAIVTGLGPVLALHVGAGALGGLRGTERLARHDFCTASGAVLASSVTAGARLRLGVVATGVDHQRPPEPAAEQRRQRWHEQRSHDQGVEQQTDADRRAELTQAPSARCPAWPPS